MTTENRYVYRTIWEPTLENEVTSDDLDGVWDIPEHFKINLEKESPKTFELEDLTTHFRSSVRALASSDDFFDGREYSKHPAPANNLAGTILYHGQELNWWISLILQKDSSPDTIMRFARTEYQTRMDSVRGIIYKIGSTLGQQGSSVTTSQFRQLFLKEIHDLNLGVIPSPFDHTSNPLQNFIASPAHFGFVLAEEPGFVYDHITQKLSYSGIMGEIIPLPFGEDQPNTLDLFYHEVMTLIYETVPDRFKSINSHLVDYDIQFNNFANFTLDDTNIIRDGVYRIPNDLIVTPLQQVTVKVNSVDLVEKEDFQILLSQRDIAFNRYKIPVTGDLIEIQISGYVDESVVPNPSIDQLGATVFDIRNYVYTDPADQTLIRCYTPQDVLDEEEAHFTEWLKRNVTWKERSVNPFENLNDIADPFSWNYKDFMEVGMPAVWYEIYEQHFGTSGLQFEPWIVQGYITKPSWWDLEFPPVDGLYPYSNMWARIQTGLPQDKEITTPTTGFIINPAPSYTLPVNGVTGVLLPPYSLSLVPSMFTSIPPTQFDDFVFGDKSPTEMQWRNSVDYRWDYIDVGYKLKPIDFVSLSWDSDRMKTWLNGLVVDKNIGKSFNHNDMVFYSDVEEIITTDIVNSTYSYISDGYTATYGGQSYDFGAIEEFPGNGLQIDYFLENQFNTGDISLVEVNGAIVTYGVDYFFVDTTSDGVFDTLRFANAPGAFAATTGSEWDARPNSILDIVNVVVGNKEFIVNANYDNEFPDELVTSINESTGNDGNWIITSSFFDGSQTVLTVAAPVVTHSLEDILPSTNQFKILGDQVDDYRGGNRFFTDIPLYSGRWTVADATFDGVYTFITAKTTKTLELISTDEPNNIIFVDDDQTLHATTGTEVILGMTSGQPTLWTVISSNFAAGQTEIELAFPDIQFNVLTADLGSNEFIVEGYQLQAYPLQWLTLDIFSSTGNDGSYTITNIYYNNDGNTVIKVFEPIPSAVADGIMVVDGTISQYNLITNIEMLTQIDDVAITDVNVPSNIFEVLGDRTSEFTIGLNFEIRNSLFHALNQEVVTSTFNGTHTEIEVVPPRNDQPINGVNTINGTFQCAGNQTTIIPLIGTTVVVSSSTGNDGSYTINNILYNGSNTVVTVNEVVSSPVSDGTISFLNILDATVDGTVVIVSGELDGRLDPSIDGTIANEQNWQWDIVGWDDISLGVDVLVRVRVGTPVALLEFDEHDEINVYVNGSSYPTEQITGNVTPQTVSLAYTSQAFDVVNIVIYNPRDIIESETTDHELKLTTGLNQWYSQFYLYRGKRIVSGDSYSSYWRNWQPNIVYRTDNIVNPDSMIVQAYGDLVFRNKFDYTVELDSIGGIRDFYLDSFLITVTEKTEVSFATDGKAPQSTIYQINNYDPRRNFVKTAVSRKDKTFRFTLFPTDSPVLFGDDDNLDTLAFRTSDDLSLVIDSIFYTFELNIETQEITLSQDAVDAIQVGGSEVIILVEILTKTINSHSASDASAFTNVVMVDDLVENTGVKSLLDVTTYQVPLEFEADEFGNLVTADVILPSEFTAQELIVFLVEYERYVMEQGAIFDQIEDISYVNFPAMFNKFAKFVDQLEVRSDFTYQQRYTELNTLNQTVQVGTKHGVIAKIESEADFFSKRTQGVLDVNGSVISDKNYQVVREDGLATIELIGNKTINTFYADNIPFVPSYIDRVDPRSAGNVFPVNEQIWFNTSTSTFLQYEEVSGEFIDPYDLIEYTFNDSALSIYTGHFVVDKFESIIRFENNTSTGRSIYKPLTGDIIRRVYVQFEKSRTYTGRPVFGGFALVPNSTTGLLEPVRNIESQIDGLQHLFDPFSVPLDNNYPSAIPDLLGLETKDYLKRFLGGASPRSIIGFQQGFIQQKGASDNIRAFVEAIKSVITVGLYEVWAYKVAEYGDNTGDDYIAIKIAEKEGARTILGLHFTDAAETEAADPGLVEIKENDVDRFPQQLDSSTTKDGNRFYFPTVEEGSVVPEWERNHIASVLLENNNFLITISSTNEEGIDFGTIGIDGRDRLVRVAAITLNQHNINFATKFDIMYHDPEADLWRTLTKNLPLSNTNDNDELVLPYHNIKARQWKLVATELNAGDWNNISMEMHRYRAKPDYDKVAKIAGYNTRTKVNVATWYPWDVVEGYHTPEAYQYIDHETEYNPALYSTATEGKESNGRAWRDDHIGELWWDKSDWGVIDYKNARQFPETIQRASLWGKLSAGKKVSVYEWVKSPVLPSAWADLVAEYKDYEGSLSERIPSGVVKNETDYTIEIKTNKDGAQDVSYYFWVTGSTIRGYTKAGQLRSLNLKNIADGLEHPDNIPQNKFYIIDHHLYESGNLPPRFTKWFGNKANQVFTSDYVDLHLSRKFLLSNNLQDHDFRSNRHEEWTLMHRGLNAYPVPELWDEIVDVLTDINAANASDYDVDDPDRHFIPRDELIRLLNKRVLEIKPNFFPTGFESASVSGFPTFEQDTPYDGAANVETFDVDSEDPYRRIRSLGDTNINYFTSDDPDHLATLMSRDSVTSFYNVGTPAEVNELFFDILEESLAFDTKKPNIFKTSWVAYAAERLLTQTATWDGTLKDLDLVLDFIETEAKPYHTHINPDISSVKLTYDESMLVSVAEDTFNDMTLNINELMEVNIIDAHDPFRTHIFLADSFGAAMYDTFDPTDIHRYDNHMTVEFTDVITNVNIGAWVEDTISVNYADSVGHAGAVMFYTDVDDSMTVSIDDVLDVTEYLAVEDNISVNYTDNVSDLKVNFVDNPLVIEIADSDLIYNNMNFNHSELLDINIGEELTIDVYDYVVEAGSDTFNTEFDEGLRIDVVEYDLEKNWYYGWYMIHDGGQNLDYIAGDGFGNPPDGIFVGLEPGLDEDPSSEDWYRWDDVKLDEQYYISSFDNFSEYDLDLLGYDLDTVGRVGYNWDGVGNNTINSNTPSGKFLRARPSGTGLLAGEYQFTHTQSTNSDQWIIAHALGHPPIVRVFTSSGEELIPLSVQTGNNTTVIYFSTPITGIARLL